MLPEGVDRDPCRHHRFQSVWRIVDGKAVYLRYDICDLPDAVDLTLPPGVRKSRSEFGTEVILILGYLYDWIAVSQEKAISIMNFFTGLELSRSQADSLLTQRADAWELQYHATAARVLFRCGVSRKKTETPSVIGDFLNGIGVTDDYTA